MAVKTLIKGKIHPVADRSLHAGATRNLPIRGMLVLPLAWGHVGPLEATLIAAFFVCLIITFVILSEYKCPRCGMQLDYSRPYGERQSCKLCGHEVRINTVEGGLS